MEYYQYSAEHYLSIPNDPGVYKFFNKDGLILYVGKAKNLRKRISSYFSKQSADRKTSRLVSEISHIEVIIVNSEFDALLLENNLIKENQPRYNILLKDDKSFPSILVTNDRFPKIYSTRRIDKSMGTYYGPYTSVKAMNSVLDLIRKLYKIRTCNYNLSASNIEKKKFKLCLEYHLGNCLGPCEGLQEESDYVEEVQQARDILKGRVGLVKSQFLSEMKSASDKLNFELAEMFKQKLLLLEKFQSKSLIVNPKITDTDVVGMIQEDGNYFINYMKIEDGSIRVSETVEVKTKMGESPQSVLQYVIPNLQVKYQSNNRDVLCNVEVQLWGEVDVIVPAIGDKKKLVDLSVKNAVLFKREKYEAKKGHISQLERTLEQLQEDLRLKDIPRHIECFDNSNIQGSNPVASMVCFKNGKPSKKDYRKFNIKTVAGPDDFSSMKEVVFRRYKRLIGQNSPLPDLVVVDGGKGQLNAATEALNELGIYGSLPVIGIAKRLEEIYYPHDQLPLFISKKSSSLRLIQQLRDEAHRFAITFHRDKRSKKSLTSELDEIKGIGRKTKETLFESYKSIARIKKASGADLIQVIGPSKARLITEYFKTKNG